MDAITGPPLSSFLQDGGLPISLLQGFCAQLMEILSFFHSKSIVHRDLNVSNLMFVLKVVTLIPTRTFTTLTK